MNNSVLLIGLHTSQTQPFVKKANEYHLDVYLSETKEKTERNKSLTKGIKEILFCELNNINQNIKIAKTLNQSSNLIGCISFEEDGLLSAAAINEYLGLKGATRKSVEETTDKAETHRLLERYGINVPPYKVISNFKEITEFVLLHDFPVVIKPIDLKGSIGVFTINSWKEIKEAYKEIKELSKSKTFLIEKYINGKEFSIEGYCTNNSFVIWSTTEKFTFFESNVEKMHISPYLKVEGDHIKELVSRIIDCLSLKFTPFHIECFQSNNKIVVNEIHTRYGGDQITSITSLSRKLELYEPIFFSFFNEHYELKTKNWQQFYGIRFLSSKTGTLKQLNREAFTTDNVEKYEITAKKGESVTYPLNSYDRLGWFITSASSRTELLEKIKQVEKKADIITKIENEN